MLLAIAILVTAGLMIFVAMPLLAPEGTGESTLPIDVTPQGDLKRRRMVVYDNLQDLEFEFKAGKIAPDDYESLRRNYLAEAAQLMLASQDQEKMSEQEALVEREVAVERSRRRQAPAEAYACPQCGHENPLPVKFCGECGAKMPGK
jgi:hypothetical protein